MKLNAGLCKLAILLFSCFCLLILMSRQIQAHPIGNPEHALENMRQIPQWHCLRYRRFDLVKRCRNYRIALQRYGHGSGSFSDPRVRDYRMLFKKYGSRYLN